MIGPTRISPLRGHVARAPRPPHSGRVSRRGVCAGGLALAATAAVPPGAAAARSDVRRIGSLGLHALSDGRLDVPLAAFGSLPETSAAADADRPVRLGANAWAIRTPTRLVLVDAGAGDALQDGFPATGRHGAALAAADLEPADVTDVIVTHMHPDHVGGLVAPDGTMRFPNAVLHVLEAEWRYWSDPDLPGRVPAAQKNVARLAVRLAAGLRYPVNLLGGPADMGEGIYVLPAPGHTPGHAIVRLASEGRQAALLADAFICGPMQMQRPEVTYVLDADPDRAVETRRRVLDMLASEGVPFAATHLETSALGYAMRRRAGGYDFAPA